MCVVISFIDILVFFQFSQVLLIKNGFLENSLYLTQYFMVSLGYL